MRRFSRKRRGGSANSIDAKEWFGRLGEEGSVAATDLEILSHEEIPASYAAVGRGADAAGAPYVVCFSPTDGGNALLAALATGTRLAADEAYEGTVLAVSPQWSLAARRRLGLVRADLPFDLRTLAVPSLGEAGSGIEAESELEPTAVEVQSIASQLVDVAARELCQRAVDGLTGLAAKYGGGLRAFGRSVEIVILAQRIGELRAEESGLVLHSLGKQRSSTALSPENLVAALDGLEGQIRRRINDKRVSGGEGGLRTRLLALFSEAANLRSGTAWPLGGSDREEIDLAAVRADGSPIAATSRERMDLPALGTFLDGVQRLRLALPVALSGAIPPLRFEVPTLLLAAKEFSPGVVRVLASLAPAHEFFEIRPGGQRGYGLASISAEEASQSRGRPPQRGRRRAASEGSGKRQPAATEEASEGEVVGREASQADSDSRGRSRRGRRRSGRGRQESAPSRPEVAEKTPEPEIEEISLFDLGESESNEEVREGRSRGRSRRRKGARQRSGESSADQGAGSADDATEKKSGARRGRREARGRSDSDEVDFADDPLENLAELPTPEAEVGDPYESEKGLGDASEEGGETRPSARGMTLEERSEKDPAAPVRRRAIIVSADDRDSLLSAVLLARDVRLLKGIWIYSQADLMNFFREILPDSPEDLPIYIVGFVPYPAVDILQAASLYRDRITWFDHHEWPPEDVFAMQQAIGQEAVHHTPGVGSSLPVVLATGSRRSRFSDRLIDLAGARFTEHDYQRWGRLWWSRLGEIAKKSGDVRAELEPLLAGRPSDLAKEAMKLETPEIPTEVAYVEERDFRLVHFGGYGMVVVSVAEGFDVHLVARIARERYSAELSLAREDGETLFFLAGEDLGNRRSLDLTGLARHLGEKLEWVETLSGEDHLARFRIRELGEHPDRLDEVIGEVAMGRSILEG
jgi:hypothetical protein